MAVSTEREYRRFTALALSHPNLSNASEVAGLLSDAFGSVTPLETIAPSNWSINRAEFLAERKLYPPHVGSPTRDRGSNGYMHDMYLASRSYGARFGPVLLVASPYIVLLHEIVAKLQERATGPAVKFIGINMPVVYKKLDEAGENASVNRVTMQVIGEPNADIVALAGKRPLHSKIHQTLTGVTVPFGIGVKVEFNGLDCRVGLDRHGRINWFQTDEDRVAHPLALLDRVKSEGALLKIRRSPLTREPSSAIVTEETT